MSEIQILLLNYFAVIFLTAYISIYVKNPDRILSVFTFWFVLMQIVIGFLVFKIIQHYQALVVIHIALAFVILKITITAVINTKFWKKSKESVNEIDDSAKYLFKNVSRLPRLSKSSFEQYSITLLKKFNFQDFKKVRVENDSVDNELDNYILAWHEGSLIEIRVLSKLKTLEADHIISIANSFRNSPSQANTLILITSADVNEEVRLSTKDQGIEFKIFDQKFIQKMVVEVAGKPISTSNIRVKEISILIIDRMLNMLNTYKQKLSESPTSSETTSHSVIKPTEAKATKPEPTEVKATKPEPTEAKATEPEPTEAKATKPEPTEAKATEPEPTESESTESESTESESTESESTIEIDSMADQAAIEAESTNQSFTAETNTFDDSDFSENQQNVSIDNNADVFDDFDTIDDESSQEEVVPDTTECVIPDVEEVIPDTTECTTPVIEEVVPDTTECIIPDVEEVVPDTTDCTTPVIEEVVPDTTECVVPDVEEVVPDTTDCTTPVIEEVVPDTTECVVPDVEEVVPDTASKIVPLFSDQEDGGQNIVDNVPKETNMKLFMHDLGGNSNLSNVGSGQKKSRRSKKSG